MANVITVAAGALFRVEQSGISPIEFKIPDLENGTAALTVKNNDSDSIVFDLKFVVLKSCLQGGDSKVDKDTFEVEGTKSDQLAHFALMKGANPVRILMENLAIEMKQVSASDPVEFTLKATLPSSKIGGAPFKIGGAGGGFTPQ